MAHLPAEKSNIAWFKLAEFVTRREKERAMGIYRLLVHSLSDEAFAAQLEGDLLLSFRDEKALECYVKSALLYERYGRAAQAAAVYEQLMVLQPHNGDYALKALMLYHQLGSDIKMLKVGKEAITAYVRQGLYEEALALCGSLQASVVTRAQLYQDLAYQVLSAKNDCVVWFEVITRTIDFLVQADDQALLTRFLTMISSLHEEAYQCAQEHLHKTC